MFKKRGKHSEEKITSSAKNQANTKDNKNSLDQKENMVPSDSKEYIQAIKDSTNSPSDLVVKTISPNLTVTYIASLVDGRTLKEQVIPDLLLKKYESPESLKYSLRIPEVDLDDRLDHSVLSMYNGTVLIHINGFSQIIMAKITTSVSRSLGAPENESQVIGAQVGFTESLSTNESLIRRYIKNPDLCNEKFIVGKQTNTTIAFLYINGIASEAMVNTLRQRISDLQIDALLDSAVLAELIDDNSLSPFPQMLLTERPDRFCDS